MLGNTVDTGESDRCIQPADFAIYQFNKPESKAKELTQIYENAYRNYPEYADTGGRGVRGYLESLWKSCPEDFLVAVDDGELLGFIVVDKCYRIHKGQPVGEVQEIVVNSCHQGRGIGPRLLDAGIIRLEGSGLKRIGLWVGKNNAPARALYSKYGFNSIYSANKWIKMERLSINHINLKPACIDNLPYTQAHKRVAI